ncbi:trypsin-like serine protease [Amycolatopsis sp. NBC_00345]|uniref:trypsin-like serine protease n=1 Tax=Amycolatopsis sp. NBC_00345 TaxID=2975955 RepID=UPI002E26CAAA
MPGRLLNIRRTAGALSIITAALLTASPAYALSGGDEVTGKTQPFLAQIQIGNPGDTNARSCSGALVAPQWVVTAASCFGGTAANGYQVTTGSPAAQATLPGKLGVAITRVVSHGDRDVALARLAYKMTSVAPATLGSTAPTTGDSVSASGYGRTATDWVPNLPRSSAFSAAVDSDTTLSLAGAQDTCKGDAGGPVLRATATGTELIGVNSTSWQHGCLGETTTRQGSEEARTDNISDWIRYQVDPVNSWAFLPGSGPFFPHSKTVTSRAATGVGHSASLTGQHATDIVGRRISDNALVAYQNNGNTTVDDHSLKAGVVIGTGWDVYTMFQQTDINGDGVSDVIARGTDGTLYAYLGTGKLNGTSTFNSRFIVGRGWNTYDSVFAADTNGDGKAELFGVKTDDVDPTQLSMWGYTNTGTVNGTSTWQPGVKVATGEKEVVPSGFADFTGDGKADLFLETNYANGVNDLAVLDQYANGVDTSGAPKQPVTYRVGSGWTPQQLLTIGDINGDGHPDLIGTATDGTLNSYVHTGTFVRDSGHGAGTFGAPILTGRAWNVFDIIT